MRSFQHLSASGTRDFQVFEFDQTSKVDSDSYIYLLDTKVGCGIQEVAAVKKRCDESRKHCEGAGHPKDAPGLALARAVLCIRTGTR